MKKGNFLNMIGGKIGKVLLATLIASLSFSFGAYSQKDKDPAACDIIKPEGEESDVGKLWFGGRFGVTASSFGDNTSNFRLNGGGGTLNSFTFGALLRYQLLDWLAVQPEISYLQSGANNLKYQKITKTEVIFGGTGKAAHERDATARDMLNTIDLSLNAVFTPRNFMPKLRPYLLLGASFGFIVNGIRRETDYIRSTSIGGPNTANTYAVVNTIDVSSNYRVFDFAINYGVGSRFKIFQNTGFLELRYRWGISNISQYPMVNFPSKHPVTDGLPIAYTTRNFAPQDLTNHTVMLTTGIMFGGKAVGGKKGSKAEKAKKAEKTAKDAEKTAEDAEKTAKDAKKEKKKKEKKKKKK